MTIQTEILAGAIVRTRRRRALPLRTLYPRPFDPVAYAAALEVLG